MPKIVVFTITDHCNQFCLFCSGEHKTKSKAIFGDAESLKNLTWLNDIPNITIVGAGEALAHPEYPKIIKYIHDVAPESNISLYTNGYALFGENMDATLACAQKVEISLNAATKKTFEALIKNAKYDQTIKNLKELSSRKPKDMEVTLMFVALKQNVSEAHKIIEIASRLKFHKVKAMLGFYPGNDYLSEDSYLPQFRPFLPVEELQEYATTLNVDFFTNEGFRNSLSGNCYSPWRELRFIFAEGGWYANLCCRTSMNLFVPNNKMKDFKAIWESPRFEFIRETVNSKQLMANKGCTLCRLSIRNEKDFHKYKDWYDKILRIKPSGELYPFMLVK